MILFDHNKSLFLNFGVFCYLSLRVLLDRAYTDYDNVFHGLNPEMLDLPPPASATSLSPATDKFASTSETNTSVRSSSSPFKDPVSSSSLDLSQILLNIKSCRWRHFRPRTLPLHELDEAHPLFRRLSRVLKRPRSASAGGRPFGSQRPVRVIPPPTATAGRWSFCFCRDIQCVSVSLLELLINSLLKWIRLVFNTGA